MSTEPRRAFFVGASVLLSALLSSAFAAGAAEEPSKPRDIGLTEKVDVRLVTMDVLVLDARDRTVPGLEAKDFEMLVDGKPVPVDTLDESCAEGGLEEPKAVGSPEKRPAPAERHAPRRIAWVLDYLHLGPTARLETLDRLKRLARGPSLQGDEILIAALTGGLRVEQAFTADLSRVVETLERMDRDISLWNGNFRHLTEEGLFAGLEALCDILATVDGPKAAVVFSQWQGPEDLEFYEPNFRRLSALAADARVAFYPVEAGGLELPVFG